MQSIVHITDLHHSLEKIKKDASAGFVSLACQSIVELRNAGELGRDPILVFTGDIVQSGGGAGDECEFDSFVKKVLSPLQNALGISDDRVILVPGNHEIDTTVINSDEFIVPNPKISVEDIESDLTEKLHRFFDFIERNNYHSVTRSEPRIKTVTLEETHFTIFNGLAGIYSVKEGGHADRGSTFITGSEAVTLLGSIPKNAVVCTHHPLEWFEETSRRAFETALAKNQCRFLSGHEHQTDCVAVEKEDTTFIKIYGGASGTDGRKTSFRVIHLSPTSSAIAHRMFNWSMGDKGFIGTAVSQTMCVPKKSENFFKRTRAFFGKERRQSIRANLDKYQQDVFENHVPSGITQFVSPPISFFRPESASSVSVKPEAILENDYPVSLISGSGLSGKSTLLTWLSTSINSKKNSDKFCVYIDAKEFLHTPIQEIVEQKLKDADASDDEAELLVSSYSIFVILDNVPLDDSDVQNSVSEYLSQNTRGTIAIGLSGGAIYHPAFAPDIFPDNTAYYVIDDVTVPTAKRFVKTILPSLPESSVGPLVGRSFKASANIGAPRSLYFLKPILVNLSRNCSLEPLNRYLLQKSIIDESLRRAFEMTPTKEIFDSEMFYVFMGQLAHHLWDSNNATFTELELHQILQRFRDDVGAIDSYFNFETVKAGLLSSKLVRKYGENYGFLVPGIEDYFLAKHIEDNDKFRDFVMSEEGLLKLPSIAQLYVAENPKDSIRINQIFSFIDDLAAQLEPLVLKIEDATRSAISEARRNAPPANAETLLNELSWLRNGDDDSDIIISRAPTTVGTGFRQKYEPQEAAAIYLQLGASIIGVTRTMKLEDRKQLFARLRPLLRVSMLATPLLAKHIANGGSVTVRGVKISADYVGLLKDETERFYIILREMLAGNATSFGTWAGSLSFYGPMLQLLKEEEDPIIRYAMLSQQIEADISASREHAPSLENIVEYPVLIDATVNHFIESLRLQSIEDQKLENKMIADIAAQKATITPAEQTARGKKINRKPKQITDELISEIRQKIAISINLGKRFNTKNKL